MFEGEEGHPVALVTVKAYVPVLRPDIVAVVPVPAVVAPPGVLVNVQIPVDGRLLNSILPVGTRHVGCVTVPITGAAGGGITVIFDASGLLVITGLPDTTLILYCVPYVVPGGIIASIIPEFTERKFPIVTGEEKLPELSLS